MAGLAPPSVAFRSRHKPHWGFDLQVPSVADRRCNSRSSASGLWIGVQSGIPPGHAKILKSGVKRRKGWSRSASGGTPINLR